MYIRDAVEAVYQLHHSCDLGIQMETAVNIASEDTRMLRDFTEEIHEIAEGNGVLRCV